METTDLTVDEMAQLLRVHRSSVLRWIAMGKLKAFRLPGGGAYRISSAEVGRIREPVAAAGEA